MTGKLAIIATPIGNLKDITLRALEELKKADVILCEDTRVSAKLLNHYGINKPLLSYHQHSQLKKLKQVVSLLTQGKNLALISDAGTPGINDPGNQLIKYLKEELPTLKIEPIPGSSALTAAASVSGINLDRFLFLGFLPQKKKRSRYLLEIINSPYPVIFYESPYRLSKTIKEIKKLNEEKEGEKGILVFKELTKKFEKIYQGDFETVERLLEKDKIKGEYVLIIFKIK